MKNIRNKRVTKLKVKDLKKALRDVDDDAEVVIGLYLKDEPIRFCYLADIFGNMKFDSVIKEKLFNTSLVELVGYDDEYCTYVERKDDS